MSKTKFKIKNFINLTKISMKFKDIIGSERALFLLNEKDNIDTVVQFKLAPVIREVKTKITDYQNARTKRIKELGHPVLNDKNEPTGEYEVNVENNEKFHEEIRVILETEDEIKFVEISYEELKGQNKEFNLPTFVYTDLYWLIKSPAEPSTAEPSTADYADKKE